MPNYYTNNQEERGWGDQDVWTAVNGTTRATTSNNVTTAPDGTSTADKLDANTESNSHYASATHTSGIDASDTYYISVFAKAAERDWIVLYNAQANQGRYFNVNTGTVGTGVIGGAPQDDGIVAYENGWYRCWIKSDSSATPSMSVGLYLAESDSDIVFAGDGSGNDGVYFWGVWLDKRNYTDWPTPYGSVATYQPPTTGTNGNSLDTDWFGVETQSGCTVTYQDNKIRMNLGATAVANNACRIVLRDGSGTALNLNNVKLRYKAHYVAGGSSASEIGANLRQQSVSSWKGTASDDYWMCNDGYYFSGWEYNAGSGFSTIKEISTGTETTLDSATPTGGSLVVGEIVFSEMTAEGSEIRFRRLRDGENALHLRGDDSTHSTAGGVSIGGGNGAATSGLIIDIYDIEVFDLDEYKRPYVEGTPGENAFWNGSGNSNSLTITAPTCEAGDMLLALLAGQNRFSEWTTVTDSSGGTWTQHSEGDSGEGFGDHAVWTKNANGNEGSITFNMGASTSFGASGRIYRIIGAKGESYVYAGVTGGDILDNDNSSSSRPWSKFLAPTPGLAHYMWWSVISRGSASAETCESNCWPNNSVSLDDGTTQRTKLLASSENRTASMNCPPANMNQLTNTGSWTSTTIAIQESKITRDPGAVIEDQTRVSGGTTPYTVPSNEPNRGLFVGVVRESTTDVTSVTYGSNTVALTKLVDVAHTGAAGNVIEIWWLNDAGITSATGSGVVVNGPTSARVAVSYSGISQTIQDTDSGENSSLASITSGTMTASTESVLFAIGFSNNSQIFEEVTDQNFIGTTDTGVTGWNHALYEKKVDANSTITATTTSASTRMLIAAVSLEPYSAATGNALLLTNANQLL